MLADRSALPVLVVGGGVGGVCTALALGRQGRRVRLLEQANQIGAIGYGVQIGPNVLPMLERLGLAQAVLAKAYLPSEILLYELNTGEKLIEIPLRTPQFGRRYANSPYMAIHRVDFHELLLAACRAHPNIDLNQSTTVVAYRNAYDSVTAVTEDGRAIEGCALIAADGLRSRLRAQMHPQDKPRETGYVAHRTILPMERAPEPARRRNGVTMWTGPGFHVIYYPLRDRSELNVVVVVKLAPEMGSGGEAHREYLTRIMRCAQPEARDVIAAVNLARSWTISDRNPVRRWADGRVVLLGDAAHATLQSLAQGAGMAIEDAVCLAELLRQVDGDEYPAAFQRFESMRLRRTARVQLESRALWEMFHCADIDAEVRTAAYRARSKEDFYRCLDWLWTAITPA
ncbi:FAD-dependent monooxygenase [Ramlibacter sp. AW1]|uniref:FAD-dependent monooxygenase n=1 Tax=Ramlibacter aurantiacus TaxID=2801330 RepID=A0A936ZTM5_9BURK|nr:FAD-dependent monooxygenase [Ramlibacter aurantiacus]MBL0423415.1 FAD-dependent monooxygenase [Ramlibacter aurantiacus]